MPLIIKGARSHNLKSIDLDIPENKLVGIVGPSGSGKSTLAFDTIFAEGQRRYLESLSSHTRLFLNKVEKADFDSIENISPTIAIEQKNRIKNQRDTLATITDIYELLSVMFANIGDVYCHQCGSKVDRKTEDNVARYLLNRYQGQKIYILFESQKSIIEEFLSGFTRFILEDGREFNLDSTNIEVFAKGHKKAFIVYDRLKIKETSIPRIRESLYKARFLGNDITVIYFPETASFENFSFSLKCPTCGAEYQEPQQHMFSFDDPQYACPHCNGFGNVLVLDEDKLVPDKDKSILAGAISIFNKPSLKHHFTHMLEFLNDKGVDVRKSYKQLSKKEKAYIFSGGGNYIGIEPLFERLETKKYKVQVKVLLSRYKKAKLCPLCKGTRLSSLSTSIKIREKSIADLQTMTLGEFLSWLKALDLSEYELSKVKEIYQQLEVKTFYMCELGLSYLELNRLAKTLSTGEMQRVNLAKHLGAFLVGTTYILDEPSVGLHPNDNKNLVSVISSIRNTGNRVIIVEHDLDLISNFDEVIELGPGSGKNGGRVVYKGLAKPYVDAINNTLKINKLRQKLPIGEKTNFISLEGIKERNLKNITLKLPINRFTCVTGISGSGKSTLLIDVLYSAVSRTLGDYENTKDVYYRTAKGLEYFDSLVLIDQNAVSSTQRSVVATYISLFSELRELFANTQLAKARGYSSAHFSFNAEGKCEHCQGNGYVNVDMQFMSDVSMVCEYCNGTRYKESILEVNYKGKNIAEVLNLSVEEAYELFSGLTKFTKKAKLLKDVGLGYLKLGQALNTLSNGEKQRLRIVKELLSKKKGSRTLYIMDEPSSGLYIKEVDLLIKLIDSLVKTGGTVVVIEHNMHIVRYADYIIDIGPGAGKFGGKIVVEGPLEKILKSKRSITAKYLV